ncbi:tRNA uridine-5-carboxymethylaminomethyl(34) synthesis GTPase MnmE [Halioxenophilus sp. WMMB6]|uniref:tRNA uridine-5-carboxymethylaminomethyl(34) synthesis GTPase MnmE n=1 Tax=Halioxenophilus sp. WMMB6 TaxID=3073815 RepID=UPI00295E8C60|nr:tRNA uridine-5-carboxymethylaminomethyl(34) synthesis GTPase MnmE [Halioxenophilus sp. WMMB6]
MAIDNDTIAAIATAPGRGGVGIVRVSGQLAQAIAQQLLGFLPKPRYAHFGDFKALNGELLDQGIALYFAKPNSFTGEDVLELQGHGGPVVMNRLLQAVIQAGARHARPGEFSERAFLNDKMDLTQAEAIADLIDAASESAAINALNTLQGQFKSRVEAIVEALIQLRIYVEAAIDFPEEEIDFLSDGKVTSDLATIIADTQLLLSQARQGALLRDGLQLVIAGQPNAGKSSLLNALAQREAAIVTDIAGTTRDILREQILIDGLPIHISDTAGIRDTSDQVEKMGVERARAEIAKAQQILVVIDATTLTAAPLPEQLQRERETLGLASVANTKVTYLLNKTDIAPLLTGEKSLTTNQLPPATFIVSAKTGHNLEALRNHIKQCAGLQSAGEGQFTARARHLDAINRALQLMTNGQIQLQLHQAGELLAEDLRQAADCLNEITGKFTSDDLLGRIFSSFCIGK